MPRYDIVCPNHGIVDAYGTPQQGIDHQVRCETCGEVETKRVYNVPYEISDNNFPGAGYVSDQLSTDGTPIRVNTRRDQNVLMQMAGLKHHEPGEYQHFRNRQREDAAASRARTRAAMKDEALPRMYYAKNHPDSKQR